MARKIEKCNHIKQMLLALDPAAWLSEFEKHQLPPAYRTNIGDSVG